MGATGERGRSGARPERRPIARPRGVPEERGGPDGKRDAERKPSTTDTAAPSGDTEVAHRERAKRCVLALGSNLGHRLDILQGAVDAVAGIVGVRVVAASPVYETAPVGGPQQPDYLNAVLLARTTLAPRDLLAELHTVEAAFDRVRLVRWGPRTLDIDIITYEGELSDDPELTLPHPRAHERAFVLAPWHDLDQAAVLPGHGAVAALLTAAGGGGIRRSTQELIIP